MQEPALLSPDGLEALIAALRRDGYRVVGPNLRDAAIVYDDIESAADLPTGWTDVQDGGTYRIERRQDEARFGYAVGPHSWKGSLHPPRLRLWRAEKTADGVHVTCGTEPAPKFAFIGVRSCDLHAIAIQDRVFLEGPHVDPHYQARRNGAFIVAVNCGVASGTCFCVSMGTGPKATTGFDIALTELPGAEHRFLAVTGSDRGAALLAAIPSTPASRQDVAAADSVVAQAAAGMGRKMDTDDLRDAARVQSRASALGRRSPSAASACGNCTMVCPTCFCTSVEDASDLVGRRRALATLGFLLHHGLLLHPRRQRARIDEVPLPPVDDPQARDLVGPVRLLRLRRLRPLHHLVPGRHRHHRGGGRHPRQAGGKGGAMIEGMETIVREHPFFAGLSDETIALVAGCTRNVRLRRRPVDLFREGDPADEFYLIRHGRVALELSAPGRGTITVQTLGEGDVVGMSWLIPPYRWTSSARALEPVRAIGIDARCLRRKCDEDHDVRLRP